MDNDERQHGDPMSTRVGANVRRWRTARNRTAQAVADDWGRLLGRPVAKSAVVNIELGRRRVTVDDLVLLAEVLNVGPIDLLAPTDAEFDEDTVPVSPISRESKASYLLRITRAGVAANGLRVADPASPARG